MAGWRHKKRHRARQQRALALLQDRHLACRVVGQPLHDARNLLGHADRREQQVAELANRGGDLVVNLRETGAQEGAGVSSSGDRGAAAVTTPRLARPARCAAHSARVRPQPRGAPHPTAATGGRSGDGTQRFRKFLASRRSCLAAGDFQVVAEVILHLHVRLLRVDCARRGTRQPSGAEGRGRRRAAPRPRSPGRSRPWNHAPRHGQSAAEGTRTSSLTLQLVDVGRARVNLLGNGHVGGNNFSRHCGVRHSRTRLPRRSARQTARRHACGEGGAL